MMQNESRDTDVIVLGGGASGLMAAGRAGALGARVVLLEKTDSVGKKILISGKARCNLTNSADLKDFVSMYGQNGRFLYSVFSRFFRPELLEFFEGFGLKTKIERGGRIFPVSDDARDVVGALKKYLACGGVRIICNAPVMSVRPENGGFSVETRTQTFRARRVIIAAGGASWPATGTTGDGCKISAALGHTIVSLRPALIPLVVREEKLALAMQGVSLRNVRATAFRGEASTIDATLTPACDYGRGEKKAPRKPLIESRFGEMLFTHFGLGGPVILLMSLSAVEALESGPVAILIDLKPAVTREQLCKRLLSDLNAAGKKKISTILKEYLPSKMVDPVLGVAAIDPDKPAHQVTAEEREKILENLKALRFNIRKALPLEKAIVTAGGVALDEIDPKTMASKKVPGLFFCGEVMDIDADTGGYNLQAAFSTGWAAGEAAAHPVEKLKNTESL